MAANQESWVEYARRLTDPAEERFKDDVLKDVVVLDISVAQPSAHVTSSILAEFGARVIKVEPPEGDPPFAKSRHSGSTISMRPA